MAERGGFLDVLFAPLRRQRVGPTTTAGAGGTTVYAGVVDDKERDSKLQGTERYKTFSNVLANTTIVAAGVRLYLHLVSKAEWHFEPADESAQAQEYAERIEDMLTKGMTTPWPRVVRRAAMYRFYGFAIQEWTAKREDDGAIGMLDVEPRGQVTIERWDLDETGTVFGVTQRSPQTSSEFYIPRSKLLYLVEDSLNDSPTGLGLFRHIVETARQLKRLEQLEGYAYETDLRGVPIGRAPIAELDKQVTAGTITAVQKGQYIEGLKEFLRRHIKNPELGLLLDSTPYQTTDERQTPSSVPQWDLSILTGGSTSHDAVANAIERKTREIAILLGIEGLLLGQGSSGSRALGETKSDTLAQIVDSSIGDIVSAVQADLVDRIMELNGWDPELTPKAKTEALQHRDIKDITGALRDLAAASAAVTPEDEAFGEVYDLLGLSRPDGARLMQRLQEETLLGMGMGPDGQALPGVQPTEPGAADEGDEDVPETEKQPGSKQPPKSKQPGGKPPNTKPKPKGGKP